MTCDFEEIVSRSRCLAEFVLSVSFAELDYPIASDDIFLDLTASYCRDWAK